MDQRAKLVLASVVLVAGLHSMSCLRCDEDEVLRGGRCLQVCNADEDCAAGDRCEDGLCENGERAVVVSVDAGVGEVRSSTTSGVELASSAEVSSSSASRSSSANGVSGSASQSSSGPAFSSSGQPSSSAGASSSSSGSSASAVKVDLSVDLNTQSSFVEPGGKIAYALFVVNDGPKGATGVVVEGIFSAGFDQVTWVAQGMGGASGFEASGSGPIEDTDISLPLGGSVRYSITAFLGTGATVGSSVSATGTVRTEGDQHEDVDSSNDFMSSQTVVELLEFEIVDAMVYEHNSGQAQADFIVHLQFPPSIPASVNYATADISATVADGDYEQASGTLVFQPGIMQQTIKVTVNGDENPEADETFAVNLSEPSAGASVKRGQGVCTIRDEDLPRASISDVTVQEVFGSEVQAVFNVTLSHQPAANVSINFITMDGTATEPGDYSARSGVLYYSPAGALTNSISVPVNGDTSREISDETFFVNLTANPSMVILDDEQGACTIKDAGAVLQFTADAYSFGEERSSGSILIQRIIDLNGPVSVTVTFTDGTASGSQSPLGPGSDYENSSQTVSLPTNTLQKAVTFTLMNDTAREGDETFTITLTNPEGASLGARKSATVTIVDND